MVKKSILEIIYDWFQQMENQNFVIYENAALARQTTCAVLFVTKKSDNVVMGIGTAI